MAVESLWFPPVDEAAAAQVGRRLHTYRASLFARLVRPSMALAETAADEDVRGGVSAYLSVVQRWSESGSQGLATHLNQWSPTYLLQRMTRPRCPQEQRRELMGLLLFRLASDLARDPDAPDVRFGLPWPRGGRFVDLEQFRGCRFGTPGLQPVQLVFVLESGQGRLEPADGRSGGWPWSAGAPEDLPERQTCRFGTPLIPSGLLAVAGADRQDAQSVAVLPFRKSIDEAHAILQEVWPQAAPWASLLPSAFADLGPPERPDLTRSESYGPGCPISMTRTGSSWSHAEDIVHEVQHHRFHLWALDRPFRSLGDDEPRYVSPWRSDVRPLFGLHLGLHAFVTVNELRARGRDRLSRRLRDEFVRTHISNLFAFRSILEQDEPDGAGQRYLREIARVLLGHDRLCRELESPGLEGRIEAALAGRCARFVEAGTRLNNAAEALRDRASTVRMAGEISGVGVHAH